MNLSEVSQNLHELPENQRDAVVGLIDTKINSDMDKFLSAIESLRLQMEQMDKRFDSQMVHMERRFDAQFRVLYWLIGIVGAVGATLLGTLISKL